MVSTISWLSGRHGRSKSIVNLDRHGRWMLFHEKHDILGILAFDIAKSVSRLVSLYKALSDDEMFRLRKEVIRGRGVKFLISDDEGFLMTLACAEKLEDLDRAATVISHLGQKCSDYGLRRFEQVYSDLKNGHLHIHKINNYMSKEIEKSIEKMEKLTSLTGELYGELEELRNLETSEIKVIEWKKNFKDKSTNFNLFDSKICSQRKRVRHLKEISLWNHSYDKVVGIMAKMVCVIYARICSLFRPFIPLLQQNKTINERLFCDPTPMNTMSGPTTSSCEKGVPLVRFLCRESSVFIREDVTLRLTVKKYNDNRNNKAFIAAPPSTVGGSGLAARYASVILLAERYFTSESLIGDQARESMYNMLPSSLKMCVRSKLKFLRRNIENEMSNGEALAEGWRNAVGDMLQWLIPMAQNTVMWQSERNLEKKRFEFKPNVLLLQTLHYADLEKTEAALVEVLVALSCIYIYEKRRIHCL